MVTSVDAFLIINTPKNGVALSVYISTVNVIEGLKILDVTTEFLYTV